VHGRSHQCSRNSSARQRMRCFSSLLNLELHIAFTPHVSNQLRETLMLKVKADGCTLDLSICNHHRDGRGKLQQDSRSFPWLCGFRVCQAYQIFFWSQNYSRKPHDRPKMVISHIGYHSCLVSERKVGSHQFKMSLLHVMPTSRVGSYSHDSPYLKSPRPWLWQMGGADVWIEGSIVFGGWCLTMSHISCPPDCYIAAGVWSWSKHTKLLWTGMESSCGLICYTIHLFVANLLWSKWSDCSWFLQHVFL